MLTDVKLHTHPEILSYRPSDRLVVDDVLPFATERYLVLTIEASLCRFEEVATNDKLIDTDLLPRARGILKKSQAL